jgi:hypothetical protein
MPFCFASFSISALLSPLFNSVSYLFALIYIITIYGRIRVALTLPYLVS